MSVLSRVLEPKDLRLLFGAGGWLGDVAQEMREDARFAGAARESRFEAHG